MSFFYKPHRKTDWNYGGPHWTLSRSKIDLFLNCARCFYIDNKLGTARPPGFPFNLNSAVDALLKKELDSYRANGTQHPLAKQYGLDAVPFNHPHMDAWRNALSEGVKFFHKETGFTIRGGVDDIWVTKDGELIVIDYKATSKDGIIESLDEDWHIGYKRQIEIYQWLLRQNGFTVSDTGYWFYANAIQNRPAFDGRLDFELTLVPYKGSTDWIEGVLLELKKCLDSSVLPPANAECDYCRYREAVGKVLQPFAAKMQSSSAVQEKQKVGKSDLSKKTKAKKKIINENTTAQLF